MAQLITDKQTPATPASPEYMCAIVPVGQTVEVAIIVGGKEVGRLGPWTGKVKIGRNAVAQVRLRVVEDSETSDFTVAAVAIS